MRRAEDTPSENSLFAENALIGEVGAVGKGETAPLVEEVVLMVSAEAAAEAEAEAEAEAAAAAAAAAASASLAFLSFFSLNLDLSSIMRTRWRAFSCMRSKRSLKHGVGGADSSSSTLLNGAR